MTPTPAIRVASVSHRYGERLALDRVDFQVPQGEIFGLLGPNGGGKTTLFRLLSTSLTLQQGEAFVHGVDVRRQPDAVRRLIGVTFQSPSLDPKLTVRENLLHHGHLYGLRGPRLESRLREVAARLDVADRLADRAETLSGGLKRRVEVAKCLLHEPRILLLDEPSTGLDPAVRHDLWRCLDQLAGGDGIAILVTTHLMEEAERCGRLGILDRGRLVALGQPDALRREVGGECITIDAEHAGQLAHDLHASLAIEVSELDGKLRLETAAGPDLLQRIVAAYGDRIRSITLGKPTLEDVFIRKTGRLFEEASPPA